MKKKTEYCGYIAIVGRPNVGKSTLINEIVGNEISITSKKKNTTQKNIIGIKTKKSHQFIYIDTPGIHITKKKDIKEKQDNNLKIIKNSILIVFIIDRTIWKIDDEIVFNKIKKNKIPIICVINKIDKIQNKRLILPHINFLSKKINPIEIIPISAKKRENITLLENKIYPYLPKKNHAFSKKCTTTNSLFFSISEIIRQQLIFFLRDELLSTTTVEIESLKEKIKKNLYIKAIIYVKKERQKKIIIGKKAAIIKKISMSSRFDIEKKMNMKVHLLIWVKEKIKK
ncbi:GTPase Era [Buchnera aphidicola (Rhopalosiphum padi)]|uniref:GTPase Era n=1 Tax=Buchnera aphidicola subsp. Rhopalosiphum padi TaxID=98793 RepID=A0A4D6Y6N3_BUCRP|nr:GTPase Era [Buchnera aphidicola]QCI24899.1 GTPase Era [Buchnera aphidicola (Rhopalosiphum padi)]